MNSKENRFSRNSGKKKTNHLWLGWLQKVVFDLLCEDFNGRWRRRCTWWKEQNTQSTEQGKGKTAHGIL